MVSPPPDALTRLLAHLTHGLESRHIPFMLIGGQAVLLHGRPRLTDDVDATLGVGPDQLARVLEACASIGLQPLPADVPGFVAETFVLPTHHPASALRVDLIFSTLPYETEAIKRAIRVRIGNADVPFATAEDLLVHKLFAGRPRDLEDAVSVIRRQGDRIDWAYVTRWVATFAEVPGREGGPDLLRRLREEADRT
jgi:predicted nucleotidyltransferase